MTTLRLQYDYVMATVRLHYGYMQYYITTMVRQIATEVSGICNVAIDIY